MLTNTMVENGLPGFANSVRFELAAWRQKLLNEGLSIEGCRRVDSVADVAAGVVGWTLTVAGCFEHNEVPE